MKKIIIVYIMLLSIFIFTTGCTNVNPSIKNNGTVATVKPVAPSFSITKKKGSYNFSDASDALATKLPSLSKDPDKEIRDTAMALLRELPKYKALIAKVPEMTSGKQIDFIMHMHFGGDETRQDLVGELISGEKLTKRILSENQYQMVAVEDNYPEEVDFESLPDELIKQFREDTNYQATLPETHRFIQQIKQFRGVFQFMEENPKQKVFGYELDPPNRLLKRIFTLAKTSSEKTHRLTELWGTMKLIHKLRSEIAIARTLEKMNLKNQQKGVLIMGYLHIHELGPIAEAIGLQSKFYVTLSQETQKAFSLDM